MTQRFREDKRWRFLFAGVLLAALILLVIGSQDIQLRPSQQINFGQQENGSGLPLVLLPIGQAIVAIAIIFFFLMVLLLVPRQFRKWGLAVLFLIFFLILSANFFPARRTTFIKETPNLPQSQNTPLPEDNAIISPPPSSSDEFDLPQISKLVLYLISFAATLSLFFIVWMFYQWRQSQPEAVTLPPLEEIGEAVRIALDGMEAGLDEKDAVINCYARMSDIVLRKRSMERSASLTAAEFATRLEAAGLPADPVRGLTRLFEAARYSTRESQPIQIEEAKACLTDIARYCGETL
jgi:hypothetical protein